MSSGRFLVSLREVNNSQKILALTSILKENINFWEEDIYSDINLDAIVREIEEEIDWGKKFAIRASVNI